MSLDSPLFESIRIPRTVFTKLRRAQMEHIVTRIANAHDVRIDQVMVPNSTHKIARARLEAILVLYYDDGQGVDHIAEFFGLTRLRVQGMISEYERRVSNGFEHIGDVTDRVIAQAREKKAARK